MHLPLNKIKKKKNKAKKNSTRPAAQQKNVTSAMSETPKLQKTEDMGHLIKQNDMAAGGVYTFCGNDGRVFSKSMGDIWKDE